MTARILSILGPVYTGSTLLSGLFNGLPGVMSIGEIHHHLHSGFGCSLCGPAGERCPVLSRLDAKELGNGAQLYVRLAEVAAELGFDVVVNSDKNIDLVTAHVPAGVSDGIVMFKGPEAYAASSIRHHGCTENGALSVLLALPQWFDYLQERARQHMRHLVYVEYEQLAGEPDETFTRLCRALDLPAPELPLVFPPQKPWHNIAGNTDAYYGVSHGPKPIYLDERWKDELSEELKAHITSLEPVQRLIESLRRLAV